MAAVTNARTNDSIRHRFCGSALFSSTFGPGSFDTGYFDFVFFEGSGDADGLPGKGFCLLRVIELVDGILLAIIQNEVSAELYALFRTSSRIPGHILHLLHHLVVRLVLGAEVIHNFAGETLRCAAGLGYSQGASHEKSRYEIGVQGFHNQSVPF